MYAFSASISKMSGNPRQPPCSMTTQPPVSHPIGLDPVRKQRPKAEAEKRRPKTDEGRAIILGAFRNYIEIVKSVLIS